jgi:Flp pilus assembly protein TadB
VRPRDPRVRQIPRRPYRDSAILYGALAIAIVVVAVATGGDVLRAVLFALGFFALAMAWSWHRWRTRMREERRG